jgi:phosphoglucomutase
LQRDYYERKPDVSDRNQLVAFGTSGHRGSALHGMFNEAHIPGDYAGDLRIPQSPGN